MNQQQNIEQQLWSYIDGLSSNEERSAIQKMIETNLEWKINIMN
jgi:anti-sigma factor RsiW